MSMFAMWLSVIGLVLSVGGVAASLGAIAYESKAKGLPTFPRKIVDRFRAKHKVTSVRAIGGNVTLSATFRADGYVGGSDPVENRFRELESDLRQARRDIESNRDALAEARTDLSHRIDQLSSKVHDAEHRSVAVETSTKNWELGAILLVGIGALLQGWALVLSF